MIHNLLAKLILELEQYSSLEKIFRYGPIKTMWLIIYRALNTTVHKHFEKFLVELDNAILYMEKIGYKVNINRVDIGELFNMTALNATDTTKFFEMYFFNLNKYIFELIKSTVDYLFDNGVSLKNVNSIQAFLNIKDDSKATNNAKYILIYYRDYLGNKPTSFVNFISTLKRARIFSNTLNMIIVDLETKITQYIKLKYSVADKTTLSYKKIA